MNGNKGDFYTYEKKTISSPKNTKTIELIIQMCVSWGIRNKVFHVKNTLVSKLIDRGFNVNFQFDIPTYFIGRQLFIYIVQNGIKKIIFSNNKSLHEKEGAIISDSLTDSNAEEIVNKIISLY